MAMPPSFCFSENYRNRASLKEAFNKHTSLTVYFLRHSIIRCVVRQNALKK